MVTRKETSKEDESTFSSIYELYADQLLSYGIGLGFDRETLKDAIQDVFCKLYMNRNSIKNIVNLKYYLFRSLKNRLLDIQKSRNVSQNSLTRQNDFPIQLSVLDELIREEDRLLIQDKIERMLSLLTGRQREAVYLRFTQEMEYDEIGKLLDMTPKAARKLIFRAMERMRDQNSSLDFCMLR